MENHPLYARIQSALDSIRPYLIEPGSIGVLREDRPYTDQQEAICHKYYMTKSEL